MILKEMWAPEVMPQAGNDRIALETNLILAGP